MLVKVTAQAIEPWNILAHYEQQHIQSEHTGAAAVFVGVMRKHNEGDEVKSMYLEHYPAMTEKFLQKLAQKTMQQWDINDVLIVHRVGQLFPDDPIVVVAIWSAHRAEAFTVCRELMEQLKTQAPFWKKEQLHNGEYRWIEKNTHGYIVNT